MNVLIVADQGIGDFIHATVLIDAAKRLGFRVSVVVNQQRGLLPALKQWPMIEWVGTDSNVRWSGLTIYPRHCHGRRFEAEHELIVPERDSDGKPIQEPCWQTNLRMFTEWLRSCGIGADGIEQLRPFWHQPRSPFTRAAGKVVAFSNGSLDTLTWRRKRWPVGHWRYLQASLEDAGISVVHFGQRSDWAGTVGTAKASLWFENLNETAEWLSQVDAVVSTDCGIGQLAAVLNPPRTLILYGPTETRPSDLGQRMIQGSGCPAIPCQRQCVIHQDDYRLMRECSPDGVFRDNVCMTSISPGLVATIVKCILFGAAEDER